ncbi:MAG: hypothetical protein V5A25_11735 [Halovenus sp.]
MNTEIPIGAPAFAKRYKQFRDDSGSWTFELREYQADLNSIASVDISPDPDSQEAYRAAVFLEGFIQEHKNIANWSDDALDQFDAFESTREVEAVAKALRETARRTDQ